MKHALLLLFAVALTGCSTTVPIKAKFPEMPPALLEQCPELHKLAEAPKLSDVSKTITLNYTLYYECAAKHSSMVEWYKTQKQIFESVK